MNRGVRADLSKSKSKKGLENKSLLKRNKSKSRSPSPQKKKSSKKPLNNNKNNKKNGRDRSPSIKRSRSKSPLGKLPSSKKINRLASQQKVDNKGAIKNKSKLNRSSSLKNDSKVKAKLQSPEKSSNKIIQKQEKKSPIGIVQKQQPTVRQQEKDMGLVLNFPEHEKIVVKQIDVLDEIYDKFLEMVNNDNDASYVMNALPEIRDLRKEDDTNGRDFISGKITRLSGVFQNLNLQKITTPLRKPPVYYTGPSGKNIVLCKLCLITKFKIQVDIGFIQYSLDGDKITIFRIYMSKIYRKMNYVAFVYLEVLKFLLEKHPAADRWSIYILERNMPIHKFFKYMGLKIEKIITDSKNKNQVDYYQQFCIKKRELQTAIGAFK